MGVSAGVPDVYVCVCVEEGLQGWHIFVFDVVSP